MEGNNSLDRRDDTGILKNHFDYDDRINDLNYIIEFAEEGGIPDQFLEPSNLPHYHTNYQKDYLFDWSEIEENFENFPQNFSEPTDPIRHRENTSQDKEKHDESLLDSPVEAEKIQHVSELNNSLNQGSNPQDGFVCIPERSEDEAHKKPIATPQTEEVNVTKTAQNVLSLGQESTVPSIGMKRKHVAIADDNPYLMMTSSFPASFLKIGRWQYQKDLVAKCCYCSERLIWEGIVDQGNQMKKKIEIKWSHLLAIGTTIGEDQEGILQIELSEPPKLYEEIPGFGNDPREHKTWKETLDFTNNQASTCRRHYLKFPAGVLNILYGKLLQRDSRLLHLSLRPFPSLESPSFDLVDTGFLNFDSQRSQGIGINHSSQISFQTLPLNPNQLFPVPDHVPRRKVLRMHNPASPVPVVMELSLPSQHLNTDEESPSMGKRGQQMNKIVTNERFTYLWNLVHQAPPPATSVNLNDQQHKNAGSCVATDQLQWLPPKFGSSFSENQQECIPPVHSGVQRVTFVSSFSENQQQRNSAHCVARNQLQAPPPKLGSSLSQNQQHTNFVHFASRNQLQALSSEFSVNSRNQHQGLNPMASISQMVPYRGPQNQGLPTLPLNPSISQTGDLPLVNEVTPSSANGISNEAGGHYHVNQLPNRLLNDNQELYLKDDASLFPGYLLNQSVI